MREPERTCVACRTARPKRLLLRVVRRPDGTLEVDRRGAEPGRGAYLCRDAACVGRAARGLARTLRARPPGEAVLSALDRALTEEAPGPQDGAGARGAAGGNDPTRSGLSR